MAPHTLDLNEELDRQPFRAWLLLIVVLCAFVTLADGYNISAAGFAAPGLVKDWHLQRAALGPLFSSSLIAGLLGPSSFGALSLRIGRRQSILTATALFGIFGILCGFCDSFMPLVACRFVAGIGMSGALAVTVAAINEFSPRRLRGTLVTIVFSGTTFGSGVIGFIAPTLVAHYSWRAVFIFGGLLALLAATLVALWLPESPKFLCLKPHRHPQLARWLNRIEPGATIPGATAFVMAAEVNPQRISYRPFFAGSLALLTPLLWLGCFVGQVVFHSFNNWLPTLMTDSGMPFERASLAIVFFQFAGTAGGWLIMRPLDRFGMWVLTVLYASSIPVMIGLSLATGETAILTFIALAGFCVLGLHFAQVFCASNVYPTSVRPLGIGLFMIVARAGGAVGPPLVGLLLGNHVSVHTLFLLAALPLAVGLLASLGIALLYQRHFFRSDEPRATPPLPRAEANPGHA